MEVMSKGQLSPEYRTIEKCVTDVVDQLALDPVSIALNLKSAEFISGTTVERVTTLGASNTDKAKELFRHVLNYVEINSSKYQRFREILLKESSAALVDLLDKTYEDYRIEYPRKSSQSCSSKPPFCRQKNIASQSYSSLEEHHEGHAINVSRKRLHACYSEPPSLRQRCMPSQSSSSLEEHREDSMSQSSKNGEQSSSGKKITVQAALSAIKDVSKWWNLGSQLGLSSEKLNEIGHYLPEEQKMRVVLAWFRLDDNPTYEKLYEALQQPSVDSQSAANRVIGMCKELSLGSSASVADSIYLGSTSKDNEDNIIEFSERTVLNAITPISNDYELGIRLGLEEHTLREIEKYPVEQRKQKLVSRLFEVKPENCNWPKIHAAIEELKVMEWNVKRPSLIKGSSYESISYPSSISNTGSSLEDVSLSASDAFKELNDTEIMNKYNSLQRKIIYKLKGVDIKDIRFQLEGIFAPEEAVSGLISGIDNIHDIFKVLRNNHFWKFNNITKLSGLAREFIESDDQVMKEIKDYDYLLVGYKMGTKIWEQINLNTFKQSSEDEEDDEDESSDHNPEKPDPSYYKPSYRKELRMALFRGEGNVRLTNRSLKYLEEIWKRLQIKFKISLESVLDSVKAGCVEIVWYIPSLSAQQLLDQLQGSEEFFRAIFVSMVQLEGVLVYSDSIGVVNSQELNEVRLLLAVQDKSLERTQALIGGCSGNPSIPMMKMNRTLLMVAAHGGCTGIVSSLCEHGAEVNQKDACGWTALSYASVGSHVDVVNQLFEQGSHLTKSPDVLDLMARLNKPAMHSLLKEKLEHQLVNAARDGDLQAVEKMLEMGANVDASDPVKELWTPLTWASFRGHLKVVECLLKHGPNVNVAAKVLGWNPLILASRNGHCEVVNALLDHGADINQKTHKGWSSLKFAAAKGQTEVGKILLERGATINCQDLNGYTPLGQAAQEGHADFVSMMINQQSDLDLNYEAAGGWTPLMLASKNGHKESARVLLLANAVVDHQKHDGVTALHIASFAGHNEVVWSLILCDANVNITDKFGVTALMFATKEGHMNVVRSLMWKNQADLNIQENEAKLSVAFFAVHCKRLDIFDLFMSSGKMNFGITDLEGKTILDFIEGFEDALRLTKEKYQNTMELMRSARQQLPAGSGAMPGAKATMDKAKDYIMSMMKNIDVRMKSVTASAA